jgi:hypothetical protein
MSSSPATLQELRSAIARLEGRPSTAPKQPVLSSGLEDLDRAVRGWPSPGVSEVVGRTGSGRLSLILPTLQRLTRLGRPVAVVDAFGLAYPPGWRKLSLEHVLVVQPGPERAAWAAEQLAASGAVPLVVLMDGPRLGRGGPRIQRAAERGGCSVLILTERSERALPAALRLQLRGRGARGLKVQVNRVRGMPAGREIWVGMG